jgi:hypothetical protein
VRGKCGRRKINVLVKKYEETTSKAQAWREL